MPMQYTENLKVVKKEKSYGYFSYFCSKHRLWVHVRTEAVLTCTHNVCFRSKIRKIGLPMQTRFSIIKVGFTGGYAFHGRFPDVSR